MTESDDPKEFPGVERAYDFVLPSYQLLASRFESADTRLSVMLNFMATLTLGVPLLARSIRPDISFLSPLFIAAVVVFLVASVVGVVGRLKGKLVLPDPMALFNTSLGMSEWDFRKNAIYFAGVNFASNTKAIHEKGNYALGVTALFMLEIFWMLLWITR